MSTANVEGGSSARQSPGSAGAPARAAAGIVAGALLTIVAMRRGFRAVTVKIGA